ncbi:MAG TPA: bacillithiol biosynthesis BshC, partial [Parasegetibacter sp.]
KSRLFPGGGLQERKDNLIPFYSRYGADFIDTIYQYSPAFGEKFIVLLEDKPA